MKRIILTVLISICAYNSANAQVGITFHQSNIPSIGVNYQIGESFLPEFRVGTDNYFEDTALELDLNYIFIENDELEFYAGLGVRTQNIEGIVFPVGINLYPLESKNFGFHIELAGIVGDDTAIRGSWGIRYRL